MLVARIRISSLGERQDINQVRIASFHRKAKF